MGFLHVVAIYCVHVLVLVGTTPVQRLCPDGQFLDQITGSCDQCRDICDHAVSQGTSELCKKLCPDYTPLPNSKLCPNGTYLDDVLLRCESCQQLCDQSNTGDCKTKCPGFLDQSSTGLSRQSISLLLWILVGALSGVLVVLIVAITCKYILLNSTPRLPRHRTKHQMVGTPFIVPYLRLTDEKPQHKVSQWLTLIHASEPETDSRYCSKASLIYNPPKTLM